MEEFAPPIEHIRQRKCHRQLGDTEARCTQGHRGGLWCDLYSHRWVRSPESQLGAARHSVTACTVRCGCPDLARRGELSQRDRPAEQGSGRGVQVGAELGAAGTRRIADIPATWGTRARVRRRAWELPEMPGTRSKV